MTGQALLEELSQLKIVMRLDGDELVVTDTIGVMTEGAWAFIAKHKAEYVAALTPCPTIEHESTATTATTRATAI